MLTGIQTGYPLSMSEPKAALTGAASQARRKYEMAKFFRDRRVASGLTLEQLAEAIGLEDIATLVAYESGEKSIPLDEVFGMTNVLNIPPEDVLGLIYDLYGKQGQP